MTGRVQSSRHFDCALRRYAIRSTNSAASIHLPVPVITDGSLDAVVSLYSWVGIFAVRYFPAAEIPDPSTIPAVHPRERTLAWVELRISNRIVKLVSEPATCHSHGGATHAKFTFAERDRRSLSAWRRAGRRQLSDRRGRSRCRHASCRPHARAGTRASADRFPNRA